jgi:hypothetical protein
MQKEGTSHATAHTTVTAHALSHVASRRLTADNDCPAAAFLPPSPSLLYACVQVDAEKRVRFVSLPPIMTFSMKRYRVDWEKERREKIDDSYAFPTTTLDLSPYLKSAKPTATAAAAAATASPAPSTGAKPAAAPAPAPAPAATAASAVATPNPDALYELNAVIIHKGGAMGGHYHAYIRDVMREGKWERSRAGKGQTFGGGGGGGGGTTYIPRGRNKKRGGGGGGGGGGGSGGIKKVPDVPWDYDNEDQNHPAIAAIRNVLLESETLTMTIAEVRQTAAVLCCAVDHAHRFAVLCAVCCVLCAEQMGTQFGKVNGNRSWKQTYKNDFGSFDDFIKTHSAVFFVDSDGQTVSLLAGRSPPEKPSAPADKGKSDNKSAPTPTEKEADDGDDEKGAGAAAATPPVDEDKEEDWRWFDFNDDDVTPVLTSALETQFGRPGAAETGCQSPHTSHTRIRAHFAGL